jgi:endoglucanase
MGFTVWSAGAFDSSYALSVTPNGNTDTALWTAAVKPLLS